MSYIRSFLPWIVFAAIPNWRIGAAAALVLTLAVLIHHTRIGQSMGDQVIELVSAGYFAVVLVISSVALHAAFHHYAGATGTGVLAVMAWAGLAAHRPFTLSIARRQTPKEIWHAPGFLRANTVITTVWAAAFTVSAVLSAILQAENAGSVAGIIVRVAGFVLPILFTRQYTASRARAPHPQSSS
ncbi:hypothetical protein [Streptomyces sp. NRRL F-5126]|uniref:hypothetical protein n=1 Tax=Streptomyces sp. NRRL F-5126 TaxID=1463857 RepID=UPI0004C9C1AD|nr:hypothetical protein [Streptomyces sp. NRRL F-5126]